VTADPARCDAPGVAARIIELHDPPALPPG